MRVKLKAKKDIPFLHFYRDRVGKQFPPGLVLKCNLTGSCIINERGELFFYEDLEGEIWEDRERSYPELKTYFWVMKWLEINCPEDIERTYGKITSRAWHEIYKGKFQVKTIQYPRQIHEKDGKVYILGIEQSAFHDYFQCVLDDVQLVFFATLDDIKEQMSQLNLKEEKS